MWGIAGGLVRKLVCLGSHFELSQKKELEGKPEDCDYGEIELDLAERGHYP